MPSSIILRGSEKCADDEQTDGQTDGWTAGQIFTLRCVDVSKICISSCKSVSLFCQLVSHPRWRETPEGTAPIDKIHKFFVACTRLKLTVSWSVRPSICRSVMLYLWGVSRQIAYITCMTPCPPTRYWCCCVYSLVFRTRQWEKKLGFDTVMRADKGKKW